MVLQVNPTWCSKRGLNNKIYSKSNITCVQHQLSYTHKIQKEFSYLDFLCFTTVLLRIAGFANLLPIKGKCDALWTWHNYKVLIWLNCWTHISLSQYGMTKQENRRAYSGYKTMVPITLITLYLCVRQKVATVPCVEWVGHFKGMQLEKVLP